MAGEAAEFLIALGDAVTPNAIKIAESVETMSASQIKAVSTTLRLDAALAKAQAARAKAAADMARANAAMQKSTQTTDEAGSAAQELGDQLGDLGGQAATVGGPVGKLQSIIAKLGPEGQAVAIALGVLTIAVTATVGALLAMGAAAIAVTEHLRLMRLRFAALAGSAQDGQAVTDMVLRLGQELPFATEQIEDWTSSLQRAGLAGKDLEAATRAVAAAAALNPKGGAEAAQDFLSKLAKSGKEAESLIQSVAEQSRRGTGPLRDMGLVLDDLGGAAAVAKMNAAELSQAIEKALARKGGGVLEEMSSTWPVIVQKAKDGFFSIFEGLDKPVTEFMGAVKSLFGEFGRGRTLMGGTRGVITDVFGTLFSWATKAVNVVHKGFLTIAIGVLTAYIAMRPLIERFKQLAASTYFLNGLKVMLVGVAALLFAIVAPALLVITVVYGITAAVVAFISTLDAAFVYIIGVVVNFAASVIDAFTTAYEGARAAGGSFVDGIVAGILAGVGRVVGAVKNLASAGLEAFKSTFGIQSPSKVMRIHGQKNIAEDGLAEGIDRGAPVVADAMARLGGEPPAGPGGGARGQARASSGDGPHYHFHYTGPADQADPFFERAQRWLETLDAEAPA